MSICVIYPNTYKLGMSNLGFQTVCHLISTYRGESGGVTVERAFLPDADEIAEYERRERPLISYESKKAVSEFDIVAFSIAFEEDYFNIPKILDLAKLPVPAKERGLGKRSAFDPMVIAGGVAVSLNPEPIADIVDLFIVGEAEGALHQFIGRFTQLRHGSGALMDRQARIEALDSLPFTYIPSLYEVKYDGVEISSFKAKDGAKERIAATKNLNLDQFDIPRSFVYTPDTAFKETFLTEVERGCGRGCRFCAAGFLYLPPRWRDLEKVKTAVAEGVEVAGQVGLVGAAVSEYPDIKAVVEAGLKLGASVTLSSLRLDSLDAPFLGSLKEAGYRTVTMAPEAGTERLRGVINKGMSDAEILGTVQDVTDAGFIRVKLYFLIGLPTETDSDALAIAELARKVRSVMKSGLLHLSINPFVPKPFTPFQFHPFEHSAVIDKRLSAIKGALKKERGITIKALSSREAIVQAYLSRADRRAGEFVIEAAKIGASKAMRKWQRSGRFFLDSVYRKIPEEAMLPWQLIDHGLDKAYLWREYKRGLEEKLTPPCDVGSCTRCGVCVE